MGFKRFFIILLIIFFYPFSYSFAQSSIYKCLDNFHDKLSSQYKKSSYGSYVRNQTIKKRRVGNQKVILTRVIDPVDNKNKNLFVTKTKAKVCDPTAEKGSRCSNAEERHLNASVGRHVSILPDVYKDTLKRFRENSTTESSVNASDLRPESVINSMSDCMRVSRKLRRKIMKKSRALKTIHSQVFRGTSPVKSTTSPQEKTTAGEGANSTR